MRILVDKIVKFVTKIFNFIVEQKVKGMYIINKNFELNSIRYIIRKPTATIKQ